MVGVPSMAAEATIREVYRPLTEAGIPLLTTDPVTAELVKGAANAFLATKVSFINAMADVCAKTGGDVATLADAVGMDARIGRAFLTAGIGYGGGCLPKDVRGLAAFAAAAGAETAAGLLAVVDEINSGRRQRVVDCRDAPRRPDRQADRALGRGVQAGHRRRARLARPGRGRPAVPPRRAGRGLRPAGGGQRPGRVPAPATRPTARWRPREGADAVLVGTAWPQFAAADPAAVAAVVREPAAHRRLPGHSGRSVAGRGLDGGRPVPDFQPRLERPRLTQPAARDSHPA